MSSTAERAPGWVGEVAAVLFDLDGTLVDSSAAVERAWHRWAAGTGLEQRLEEVGIHGRPSEGTIRLLDPDLDEEGVRESSARLMAFQYEDRQPLERCAGADFVLATVERLGIPWAIVTSCDRRLAALRLEATGIRPPVLVTSEDIATGKPAPDGYLRAAALLAVPIDRCLVVEDAEPGVEAGRRAGARTAALGGLESDLELADLEELAALLDRAAPTSV